MRISLFALLALGALASPAEAQEVSPSIPPAPPRPVPVMLHFDAASVQCGDVETSATLAVTPYETVGWQSPPRQSIRFRFRIDATGRPLGIARIDENGVYIPGSEDLAPALAATRFAAGAPRRGCIATYMPSSEPLGSAPKAQLYRYYAMPHRPGSFERQVFNMFKPAGSDCYSPPAKPRTINFPDFDAIAQAAGTASFVVIGYDLDKTGIPANVHVLGSDGNAALDRAGVEAVATSRFAPEPRTGCIVRFDRRQTRAIAAPPAPDTASYKLARACPGEPGWAQMPRLVFPDAYNRRSIEGWAMIGYDVAPWGETGNVHVLASEPTEDFGKAAVPIVQAAHKPKSDTGLTGCVTRVRFVLPPPGTPQGEDEDDTIVND